MADATVLGVHPPCTVRINMGGWVQDWPHHLVQVAGDVIQVFAPDGSGAVHYPYEHARELAHGQWRFHGAIDFTVTSGPPQLPSMDTAGPR